MVAYRCYRCEKEFWIALPFAREITVACPHCDTPLLVIPPPTGYEITWGKRAVEELAKLSPREAEQRTLRISKPEPYLTYPSQKPLKHVEISKYVPSAYPYLPERKIITPEAKYIPKPKVKERKSHKALAVIIALIILIPTGVGAFLFMDSDGDGFSNLMEYQMGLNPFNSDTDGDGLSDWIETNTYKTDPKKADTDDDGLTDHQELFLTKYSIPEYNPIWQQYNITTTNPLINDTDGDGLIDGDEVYGIIGDFLDIMDFYEYSGGEYWTYEWRLTIMHLGINTNPLNDDTDNDGLKDGAEIGLGNLYSHGRPLLNLFKEEKYPSSPVIADMDLDGLKDGAEIILGTNLTNPDTDNDQIIDGWEAKFNLNPLNSEDANKDFDNDNLTNFEEYKLTFVYLLPYIKDINTTYLQKSPDDLEHLVGAIKEGCFKNYTASYGFPYAFPVYQEIYDLIFNNNLSLNPLSNDSDEDGMSDGWEDYYAHLKLTLWYEWDKWRYPEWNDTIKNFTLSPLNPLDAYTNLDTDTLTNLQEYQNRTHPKYWDTDYDYLPDDWEVKYGLDPLNSTGDNGMNGDPDNDSGVFYADGSYLLMSLDNLGEYILGTDPKDDDTDDDGMPDGWEVCHNLNPLIAENTTGDADNDGLTNLQEYQLGGRPNSQDLFLEIDYMAGYGPSQYALDYFKWYFLLKKNIHVHIILDEVTNTELSTYVTPDSLNAEECSIIEQHFHNSPNTHVYVFYAKSLDDEPNPQLGWARYDFGAFIDRKAVNDAADSDWWYSWIPGIEDVTREELDTAILMHEVGHCLNIIEYNEDGTEKYCSNSSCVMSASKESADGSSSYCDYHWSLYDLTDKWSVDEAA